MPAIALVLYGLWFVLAFGARIAVAVCRTGDTGVRGIHATPFSTDWFAGVLFLLALVIGVAAPVAALAGLDAIGALDHAGVAWTGVAIAVVGIFLTLAAQLSMGDSWRIGVDDTERTALVTQGAFALVRSPIYTAMLVTAVGLVLAVPNVIAVVGFIALVVGLELQVRAVEEPYLRTVHGAAYERYLASVGRFVPGLGLTQ